MKILSILEPGSSGKPNEDAIYLGNTTFGVFDGASSLTPYTSPEGHSGAYIASHIAKRIFESDNEESTLYDTIEKINEELAHSMDVAGVDRSMIESLWSTSAAVVRIKSESIEYIQITDSIIFIIKDNGSYEMLGESSNHDYEVLKKLQSFGNEPQKLKRAKVHEDVIELRKTQNAQNGYGVLSGDENYKNFINFGEIPLSGVEHILIFTDGMMPPTEDLDESRFDELIKHFLETGLIGTYNWVRSLEQSDPECIKYPRYKMHDDLGAISISL